MEKDVLDLIHSFRSLDLPGNGGYSMDSSIAGQSPYTLPHTNHTVHHFTGLCPMCRFMGPDHPSSAETMDPMVVVTRLKPPHGCGNTAGM